MARIFDVIEVPDQSTDEMVHRFPDRGPGDFRLGSQVIVREAQNAVFFRDGKALDTFGPGRHTISTANIPLLIRLIGVAFGDRSPFTAEVYFVNMREFIDMKWGTPEPIALRDQDLGMVRLRAFGTYSMQVNDPQLFVNKIVGTRGLYQTGEIEGFLRSMVISRMTDIIGELKVGLFDLPAMYDEIGGGLKARVQDDFDGLGVTLKTLFVNSISPTEETQRAIDQRAAMGAIGDMNKFMQYQAAQAMRDAAQRGGGEAGGLVGAGMGLGAGAGLGAAMASMMGQAMQAGKQPAQETPAGAPAAMPDVMTPAEAATYLRVSEEDVVSLIEKGELKARKIGTAYRISKEALNDCLKG
jgi:excisionase family DNA binding protein